MAYTALYRQWRPKDFSHMVGQEAIVDTLRNQVTTGRIAHAYLFCGSRGTGKTSTARIFSRAINCLNPNNGDPCGECENCRRLAADESLDLIEIDAASNSRVEETRELLETVIYPPQFGKYKVYIVDEVHMMSGSAFNALLKTLEEPPEHVVFILATTEPQKLPATILSRCQRYDFGRIPAVKIQGRLKEAAEGAGKKASPGALMAIARAAEGGMRDALSILDMCLGYDENITEELVRKVLGTSDRAFLFRFTSALADENPSEIMNLINELMRDGKDPLVFSKDVSAHVRALLMAKFMTAADMAEVLELTEEDAEEYRREGERFGTARLMDILDRYMQLETDLRYAASPRIALENASLKCCLRTEPTDALAVNEKIGKLEERINELADKFASGAFAAAEHRGEGPSGAGSSAAGRKKSASASSEGNNSSSAPSSPKAAAPTGGTAEQIWKDALKILQKTEPGVSTPLGLGKFMGAKDGNIFVWQAPGGMEILAASLNTEKKKGLIETALTERAGYQCGFMATDTLAEKKKSEEVSDEKYVDSLGEVFGKEAVVVLDKM